MRVRVLGGGWYGSHLSLSLIAAGHAVELHEIADRLFAGASGANPGRLHLGFHYPRSKLTRAMCQEHQQEFMARYGRLTRGIPVNIYAVAKHDSLVDFGTYCQLLGGEVHFIPVASPGEFGLQEVEGAVLTGERHILVDRAREYFTEALGAALRLNMPPASGEDFDLTIDCTFCARDGEGVDRYEPCVVGLMQGPTDRAVTIMDGPFPSLYPWDEGAGLSSLTSARFTPLSKACRTYEEAKGILAAPTIDGDARERVELMRHSLERFWPESRDLYQVAGYRLAIRAMPRSGADARLVDVVRSDAKTLRIRAGKIDAVFHAERLIKEALAA